MGRHRGKDLVAGLGINDADYQTKVNGHSCPFYLRWSWMIKRVAKGHAEVCSEWIYFSKFKSWMEQQDWEGKELDKDLLDFGSNIYSPEKCLFIDRKLNSLFRPFSSSINIRGTHPVGNRFKSIYKVDGKSIYIGTYDTEIEAHIAWQISMIFYLQHLSLDYEGKIREAIRKRAFRIISDVKNNNITRAI